MNVLFASIDIFDSVGGGQTFFKGRAINGRHKFYYYCSKPIESPYANVFPIEMTDLYRSKVNFIKFNQDSADDRVGRLAGKEYDFLKIMDLAASVAGRSFDIVEIPDYLPFAAFLPAALRYHKVHFGRIVLSMHGTLSDALRNNWSGEQVGDLTVLSEFEDILYRLVDIRYGISHQYTQEWYKRTNLPSYLVDVCECLDIREFSRGATFDSVKAEPKIPDISFVGRQEKWKGPDIFVDICSRLSRDSYNDIALIGPEVVIDGHRSSEYLNQMAARRDINLIQYVLDRKTLLTRLSQTRIIAMFPSRHDTFNLAALEAVMSGCPIVVSTACGVVHYLDNAFPELPYIKFNLENVDDSFRKIQHLIDNYDKCRSMLHTYLVNAYPRPYGDSLDYVYAIEPRSDANTATYVQSLFDIIINKIKDSIILNTAPSLNNNLYNNIRNIIGEFSGEIDTEYLASTFHKSNEISSISEEFYRTLDSMQHIPSHASDYYIKQLQPYIHNGDRVAVYRLLADIERERGNEMLYATYWLRCIRLTGRPDPIRLNEVVGILERNELSKEAEAAHLLFGQTSSEEILRHLRMMKESFMNPPPDDLEEVISFRTIEQPKATIVVSVYNGAGKIRNFLRGLGRLTASSKSTVEVLFVDSASIDDTRNTLLQEISRSQKEGWGLSALYIRSRKRETIQFAWNRGITHARGEYLSFLGIDEMNRADAFDIMIDYLDRHPAVDWVQGNAVVTEVDQSGTFIRDIMPYRRRFATTDMHYLDCCYIGYVGALYRKSIHDRLGYYDASFRGAGDTEFKNRILPWITAKTIDHGLGFFLNYPDERVTQSSAIELEDMRAWYLYRTVGGMRYAYDGRDVQDAIQLFKTTLSYRKTYMDIDCTDIELGTSLAHYIRKWEPQAYGQICHFATGLSGLLDSYRQFDEINRPFSQTGLLGLHDRVGAVETAVFNIMNIMRTHRFIGKNVCYAFRNDNRSHQHHTIWSSIQRNISVELGINFGDLAGPQDLAELLSSCGAYSDEVDFERAWSTGSLQQVKRLFNYSEISVLLPASGRNSSSSINAFVSDIAKEYLPYDNYLTLLVAGDIDEAVRSVADARVFFSGIVRTWRPLYAAAKVVAFPAFGVNSAPESVESFCQAIAFGKPVVATSAIISSVESAFPGIDLSAVIIRDDPSSFCHELIALVANPLRRKSAVAQAHALRNDLIGRSEIRIINPSSTSASHLEETLIEWSYDIASINRSIRQLVEDNGKSADLGRHALISSLSSNPALWRIISEIIEALYVSKSAPILKTEQPIFKEISQIPADGGARQALSRFGITVK